MIDFVDGSGDGGIFLTYIITKKKALKIIKEKITTPGMGVKLGRGVDIIIVGVRRVDSGLFPDSALQDVFVDIEPILELAKPLQIRNILDMLPTGGLNQPAAYSINGPRELWGRFATGSAFHTAFSGGEPLRQERGNWAVRECFVPVRGLPPLGGRG
jgi:hypothetical protein